MKYVNALPLLIGSVIFLMVSCHNKTTMKEETNNFGAVQFRIARPTNNLQQVVAFYKEALGLKELGSFKNHDGYDGVMLGLPGEKYHLEFTQHDRKPEIPEPTKENLLVFYFDTPEKYQQAIQRMTKAGIVPVAPENPYWKGKSETYEDPDKWRIILFNGIYKP